MSRIASGISLPGDRITYEGACCRNGRLTAPTSRVGRVHYRAARHRESGAHGICIIAGHVGDGLATRCTMAGAATRVHWRYMEVHPDDGVRVPE